MRLSLRARITVMFVATVLGVGAALIGLVYAYLKLTPVPVTASFPGAEVVIDGAVPITDEILRRVLATSLTVLAILTVFAGTIGWFVAGLVIKPVRAIADDAATVTRGDLGARIAHPGSDDEVGELADALNTMLDELAGAIKRQQRFASNASHELKTPIATIQTMADVALSSTSDDVLRPTLQRVREVNARSADTVAALLQLANVDVHDRRQLDMAELCKTVAAEHRIPADVEPATANASPTLARQAVDNLVRNALAHGDNPVLTLRKRHKFVEVTVESGGARFTDEEVRTWTEPFARGERTAGKGQGLGLALVDAIASAHGGSVELAPRAEGGLVVKLLFPA